ncbi:R10B2 protein, partial [Grantiella picta]|nr:R10B2 protein [Grantiella picta]
KKKDAKKKDGQKAEESLGPTTESSSTDLRSESVNEETQAIPEAPDKEPEEPVEPPPPFHEEHVLVQMIIKSYEGEQVDAFYEGEGFICFEGGNTYKGQFSEGRMNGKGIYTWADGVKFEGTFIKNVPMDNGCYTWSDGSVYEGSIKDGLRHGFGIFRSGTCPVSYVGDWCNGKRHGKGVIYYDEEHTSWYSGEWVNNVKEGWGMRRYRSGNTYEGQWEKNLRHGHGKMIWVTANQEYIGQWESGMQHGYGTYTWFLKRTPQSQYPLRNEYMGDFVKGERHGHGTFVYAGGAMYIGEWLCNKKHGKGKFIFKNGHIFEGEFIEDRPVENPALAGAAVETKKQRAIGRRHGHGEQLNRTNFTLFTFFVLTYFICVVERNTIVSALGRTSTLGSDIELDISVLLDLFPRDERGEELKHVELAVLRHISKLRQAYYFYSHLGNVQSLDNTYVLTKLQFWRFLKDCEFHLSFKTLVEMDRLLRGLFYFNFLGTKSHEDIHCPHEMLLFRTFLSYLVHLAFHMYHEEYKDKVPHLQKCFLEMMSRNVLPSACCVQGILFSGEQFTVFAMSYIDKCWEIYRYFCSPCPRPPFESTVKMRHFVWMLDDFKLLSEQLTAPRLVEIFVRVGCCVPDVSGVNLDLEMVFLDFFEALLECALVYVTHDMISEQVAQDNQKRSSIKSQDFSKKNSAVSLHSESSQPQGQGTEASQKGHPLSVQSVSHLSFSVPRRSQTFPLQSIRAEILSFKTHFKQKCPTKETFNLHVADESKEERDEQEEEFSLWMCQVQTFFTTKLFPAFQHEIVLREKIKEIKKEDAELAGLRKIEAEELAR